MVDSRRPFSGAAHPPERSAFQQRPVSPSLYITGADDVEDEEEEDLEDEDENGGVEYVPFDDL
jgi:hypothetical protein